jgi:hypothetical protein
MINAGIERKFHDIIEHDQGSTKLKLKGDCSKHFETGKSSITVIRDENCLQWLCEEALRRCGPDLRVFFVEEVAYSFPYTLVTKVIMTKLQLAVNMADKHFPRQIWECIKLPSLDNYVKAEKKHQHAINLISSEKSLIHEYRKTYLGARGKKKGNKNGGANADAYGADGNYILPKGKGQLRHDSTHPRRFVLSAETQIGKTGAYCWFLKLLNDEIYGEVLPDIPDKPVPLPLILKEHDKIKWLLPYWGNICLSTNRWEWNILPGKYHLKVKLQRLRLLLSVLKDGRDDWKEHLIERLKGLTDGGECVQTQFHAKKLDELRTYLESVALTPTPLILRDDAWSFEKPTQAGEVFLQRVIDWDIEKGSEDSQRKYSVYWAGLPAENTDFFSTPGLSEKHGCYVLDETTSFQTLAFERGCKTRKQGAPDSVRHDCMAKVPVGAASQGAEQKDLADGSTNIKGQTCKWEALFGARDSNVKNWPLLSIPKIAQDAFIYDASGRIIEAVSQTGRSRFWIFTPSYRRHLQGVASALLDRSGVLGDAKDFVQVLIVRRGEEFDRYREDFGQYYVVIGMPHWLELQDILKATGSTQFKSQFPSGDSVKVDAHAGGIGYSRLFIQIFSRLMELSSVWVMDDNVQACYIIDIDSIFRREAGDERLSMPPPKLCSFSKIIRTISAEFGCDAERTKFGEEQKQGIENLLSRERALQPCPITGEGRQTPRCDPRGCGSIPWKSEDIIGYFSGQSTEFAVVGMSRDPGAFHRFAEMEHPFKVSHSVYSFYLLNVQHTVDRGIFYPPKQFQEDIHFNQLCEEKHMAVLKYRHLFHHKKNLQTRNPSTLPEEPTTLKVPIRIAGNSHEIEIAVGALQCQQVWPKVLNLIEKEYQGCIVARAHGKRDGGKTQLALEGKKLSTDTDVGAAEFNAYEVDLLYPVVNSGEGQVAQMGSGSGHVEHKDILHAWMASNKICSLFTFPDLEEIPKKDVKANWANWKLLDRQGDEGGSDDSMRDASVFRQIRRKFRATSATNFLLEEKTRGGHCP